MSRFRECVVANSEGSSPMRDVSLYFVHWLTDIAGAEPTPLAGSQKFATKFPLAVLNAFLHSFGFIQRIAEDTETQVMEEYLKEYWTRHSPSLGPLPSGPDAVARLRLACMSQARAADVLRAFGELCLADREVLSREMAKTGCSGQRYSLETGAERARANSEGPAFLMYYGPAFLQRIDGGCAADAVGRLRVLAEVFRGARSLWAGAQGLTVTLRLDKLLDLDTSALQMSLVSGDKWVLMKKNDVEAAVEKLSWAGSEQPSQLLYFLSH